MKQSTIALLILMEAALLLGIVGYASGAWRMLYGAGGTATQTAAGESGAESESAEVSQNRAPEETEAAAAAPEEAEEAGLPEGMAWSLQYHDVYRYSTEQEALYLEKEYTYDGRGQLISVEYYQPDGTAYLFESYQYDEAGRLLRFVRTSAAWTEQTAGATVYTYDEEGRRIREESYDDAAQPVSMIAYEYDEEGRDSRVIYYLPSLAEDGAAEEEESESAEYAIYKLREYSYNADGELIRDWSYFPDGRIADAWEEYSYDEEGRLLELRQRESDGALLMTESYYYNESGNLIQIESTGADGALRWRHYRDYDAQGERLIHTEMRTAEGMSTWQVFLYDEEGRQTQLFDNAGEQRYIYDENGLLSGTARYAGAGEPATEYTMIGREVYTYQPVPAELAVLPDD